MFWLLAFSILLSSGLFALWPMLRERGLPRSAGLASLSMILVMAFLLYREVGTPAALDASSGVSGHAGAPTQGDQIDSMLAQLSGHLEQNPEDIEGWVLLGRSYKTLQNYSASAAALEKAMSLAPGNAMVMVELAESRMFASGNPRMSQQDMALLKQAVGVDPVNQKGLWLLGVASVQAGKDEEAVEYWTRLVAEIPAGSPASNSVQEQLNLARNRLGIAPVQSWPGIEVTVSAPHEMAVPKGSVLFIIARTPGIAGPPVGVVRVADPVFPITVRMDDANSMIAAAPVSSNANLELLARLSASGNPARGQGDAESAPSIVETSGSGEVQLFLTRN